MVSRTPQERCPYRNHPIGGLQCRERSLTVPRYDPGQPPHPGETESPPSPSVIARPQAVAISCTMYPIRLHQFTSYIRDFRCESAFQHIQPRRWRLPQPFGLRNDGGSRWLVLLFWLFHHPNWTAGWCSAQRIKNPMIAGGNHTLIQMPPALQGKLM